MPGYKEREYNREAAVKREALRRLKVIDNKLKSLLDKLGDELDIRTGDEIRRVREILGNLTI